MKAYQKGLSFEVVKKAYEECGDSKAAAKKLGCSQATVSYWLRGHNVTRKTKPYRAGNQTAVLHLRDGDPLLDKLIQEHG